MEENKNPIRVFTWHIHGSYLFYLSQANCELYVPVNATRSEGYIGRGTTFPFSENVIEVPVEEVKNVSFDCVLYQSPKTFYKDRFEILSDEQQSLPAIYLEHDPPQEVPTDTNHFVDDPNVTVVHVTHFNKLMWNNRRTPAVVIDHGVVQPKHLYTGELDRGIVVINNLNERGRRLGLDIFLHVRQEIPLDLIGMGTEKIGGLGEILHPQIPAFIKNYRFFFNPIRYTSLGLAVIEAMMIGLPVVGLATTEMVSVIKNEKNGILSNDLDYLITRMRRLLKDKSYATSLGLEGKRDAHARFNLERFIADWGKLFDRVVHNAEVQPNIAIPSPLMS